MTEETSDEKGNAHCWMEEKLNMKKKVVILAFAFLGFFAGCGTVSVDVRGYAGAPNYTPTDTEAVKILRSAPTGKYERLGDIFVEPKGTPTQLQIFLRLKMAASNMGANAVVLVADQAKLTGGPVADPQWWGRELQPGSGRTIVGVAIWHPQSAY
jgi:hypothetical protein